MRTLSKPIQYLAALLLSILSVPAADESALRSLVDAEKTFAATSLERGIRDSFLQFFAENSIIFAPEPKNGKKFYTYYADEGRSLTSRPIFATIASSGELGVDYRAVGAGQIRNRDDADRVRRFSVDVTQAARPPWKVIVDVGVDHDRPPELPAEPPLFSQTKTKASRTPILRGARYSVQHATWPMAYRQAAAARLDASRTITLRSSAKIPKVEATNNISALRGGGDFFATTDKVFLSGAQHRTQDRIGGNACT